MGELTPGTQLSMGSAKRLYVLMAGFYMQWAFKTSAVKSRHRIFTFRSPACYPRVSLLAPRVSSLCPETVREEEHFHPEVPATRPAASQIIYRACSERTDSHQDCHWEFTFNVQPQIPMTVAEPFGTQAPFSAWEDMWNSAWRVNAHKHERREAGGREQKHAAEIRRCWIILAIVINLSFELTSLVVPSKAKGGKERKKKKKLSGCLRQVIQHVACILWFPHPCQTQRMFWQNKKPHVSVMTDTEDVKGRWKNKRGDNKWAKVTVDNTEQETNKQKKQQL